MSFSEENGGFYMRVIAGSARRLQLKAPEGMDTRPTVDRVKESLFNMLNPHLYGCAFLDLFSGSGAIGIEALSRGAAKAVFVDKSEACTGIIRQNLNFTKLSENAEIIKDDIFSAIKKLGQRGERFDIIFMDPPYNHEFENRVLEYLSSSPMVTEDTLIIIEASKETDFDWLSDAGFHMIKEKVYKTNKHIFAGKGA